MFLMIVKIIGIYFVIALIVFLRNFLLLLRVNYNKNAFIANCNNSEYQKNADLSYRLFHLSVKAHVGYELFTREDLRNVLRRDYFIEVMDDMRSYFKYKMQTSFSWGIRVIDWFPLFLTSRRHNFSPVLRAVLWLIQGIVLYLLAVFLDKNGYGLAVVNYIESLF